MLCHKKKTSLFDIINTALVIFITFIVLYPLYFCVIASFSSPMEVAAGNTLLWIKKFTLECYKLIIEEEQLWIGYRNTVFYTVLGTLYNLLLTIPTAYVLSKNYLPFRSALSWYYFITMYIGGGMIPTYMLMKNLHLVNTPLALILGAGVSCYNMIITRQYFSTSIHPDIYEASYIDGASEWRCFCNIAMPLAKPIIAVMTLYYGVGHWNSYYNALLYIYKKEYYPLQLVLRNILITNQLSTSNLENVAGDELEYMIYRAQMSQGMKYSIVIVSSLPLILIYPFIQKYFAKGVMIGSVKG